MSMVLVSLNFIQFYKILLSVCKTLLNVVLPDSPKPCAVHLAKALHSFSFEGSGTVLQGGKKLKEAHRSQLLLPSVHQSEGHPLYFLDLSSFVFSSPVLPFVQKVDSLEICGVTNKLLLSFSCYLKTCQYVSSQLNPDNKQANGKE